MSWRRQVGRSSTGIYDGVGNRAQSNIAPTASRTSCRHPTSSSGECTDKPHCTLTEKLVTSCAVVHANGSVLCTSCILWMEVMSIRSESFAVTPPPPIARVNVGKCDANSCIISQSKREDSEVCCRGYRRRPSGGGRYDARSHGRSIAPPRLVGWLFCQLLPTANVR